MAEEKAKTNQEDIQDDNVDKDVDKTDDKDTNKTYDQSEFDKEVAKREAEIKAKYVGHDDLKKRNDELEEEKKKRDLAAMTETEKAQARIQELELKEKDDEKEKLTLRMEVLKNQVLSQADFIGLPNAYKQLVKGETQEEMEANAKVILDQYNKDFKAAGGTPGVPPPPNLNKGGKTSESAMTPGDKLKAMLARKAKERNNQL